MTTDQIRETTGSSFLARQLHSRSGVSGIITCDSWQSLYSRRDKAGPVVPVQGGGKAGTAATVPRGHNVAHTAEEGAPSDEAGSPGAPAGCPVGGIRQSRQLRISD